MITSELKNHAVEAAIFCVGFCLTLSFYLMGGWGGGGYFLHTAVYSVIFGIFEIIKIFLVKGIFRFIFFFVNMYAGLLITNLIFVIKGYYSNFTKSLFFVDFSDFVLLLCFSLFLTFIGYGLVLIRFVIHIRRKRK